MTPTHQPTRYRQGTHRSCPPEQTWERVQPLLSVAGITRVADLTWLDDLGIPTAQAVRPLSLTLSVSQGKGISMAAAKVSAVMESLETWHAESVPVDLRDVTPAELGSQLSYDPAELALSTDSLYHPDARMDWVQAVTVATGRSTWLPHSAVLLDASLGTRYEPRMFARSSNGLASGNTAEEAVLHGLYELLERDARTRALISPVARTLDPRTITDDQCAAMVRAMSAGDNGVRVLDVSGPDGTPTYWAQLFSRGLRMTFSGSGTHLDPAVALSRALTEAAQSRLTAIAGTREDLAPSVYAALGQPWAPSLNLEVLSGAGHDGVVSFDCHADRSSGDLEADLVEVTSRVTRLGGTEPVVSMLCRPDSDLPVARVHAPGLLFDASISHRVPSLAPLTEAAGV